MPTLTEAALRLHVHPDTLRRQIHRKKLKGRKKKLGGYALWTVSEKELERYVRENKK